MLKAIAGFVATLVVSTSFAATAVTPNDLSGTYACTGNDSGDGNFQSTLTITVDAKNSKPNQPFNTYRTKESTSELEKYSGEAISSSDGSMLSAYYSNNDPDQYKDEGVSSIVVTENAGKTTLQENYYEPDYSSGETGSEVCVKQG
jgi:hypothetical protein